MLSVRDVWKSFGPTPVLRGVDLEVAQGEVVCLLGRSGSGKSTLLRCISHLELVDAGVVAVDGHPVGYRIDGNRLVALKERELSARRREIGMVFQHFHLFPHMTALQNVAYAPVASGSLKPGDADRKARDLLDRVGLSGKEAAFPEHLSGGQQQRVAIARALAMDPKLMLFDEPTSALDPELVRDVLDVMRALADEGMTMVVVTHELGFARDVADSVAFMEKGRIVEEAPPAKFFGEPETTASREFLGRMVFDPSDGPAIRLGERHA